MAKFKYRMQNILNLKYKLEEQQKMALASARRRLADEEERLELLQKRKSGYEDAFREEASEHMNIQKIRALKAASETMDLYITEQREKVKTAEKELEKEKDRMNEAMQNRKIQEKLREKSLHTFLKELNSEETAVTDELVSYGYSVKRNE